MSNWYIFSGIVETSFKKDALSIALIDVGGQRPERKKWLHCFDSVDMVLFVVAMSEYDQTLEEDPTVNRLHESLKLFESICNIKWFQNAAMMLFLNKKDVFDEKIEDSPLKVCFSDYTGSQEKNEASDFLAQKFSERNTTDRSVYHHFTCAKDPANITSVFDVVVDNILHSRIQELGFE